MMNDEKLEKSYEVFRAVAHPLRIEILNFIAQKGETNVHGIYHALDIPQSVTSQQLKILKDAALVKSKAVSKERVYSINYPVFSTCRFCDRKIY
jgi:predicted transcriptional regulator